MADSIRYRLQKIGFIDQLRPFVEDDSIISDLITDLHDLIEASEWLVSELESKESVSFTLNELEDFLVKFDVIYVKHVEYHIKSLQRVIDHALERFPEN